MCFALKCALPALVLLTLPALPAFADPTDAPAEPSTDSPAALPEPKEEKKVCKTITFTGSRLPGKKVCRTKEEWDELTEQTQEDMRSRQRSSGMPDRGT